MDQLVEQINNLPPHLQQQVAAFVESLLADQNKKRHHRLRQDWAGALSDYRQQYTALELQRETIDNWTS